MLLALLGELRDKHATMGFHLPTGVVAPAAGLLLAFVDTKTHKPSSVESPSPPGY